MFAFSASAPAATHVAVSASFADVQAAVNAASPGDTVLIPAGSAIWGSTLGIGKNISLIGAGAGQTVISGASRGEGKFLIQYTPSSVDNHNLFRISGFTFNITEQNCIELNNPGYPPVHMVRIDNNHFQNSSVSRSGVFNRGCWGVIDHNVFDGLRYPMAIAWGSKASAGSNEWANLPDIVFGTPNDNMYVEDNVITGATVTVSDGDQGGRYVFRYNYLDSDGSMYPWFDMHGGRTLGSGSKLYSGMGGEIYGNMITTGGFLCSHRGGRMTVHHNQTGGARMNLYNNSGCPPSPSEERQSLNGSYYFLNRDGASGDLADWGIGDNDCGGGIQENVTFWVDSESFNGTSGVGWGPLSNRPATCTKGVGYWATEQSVTSLSGMVGTNPVTPIEGTFYYASADNEWSVLFTPWVYPHPLVTGEAQTPRTNPVISITPLVLDFGSVEVGSTNDRTFTVRNVAGGTLVGTAAVSAPFSIVGSSTYSLGSNDSATVTVRFRPDAVGNHSETVTFTGGNGASATATGSAALPLGASFDASEGIVTPPYSIDDAEMVSQSVETLDPGSGGRAAYSFSVTNFGNYVVLMSVSAPDEGANSVFVNVDGEPISPDHIWDVPVNSGFVTSPVTLRQSGGAPTTWTLASGTHTLVVRGREAGCSLSHISIVLSTQVRPVAPANLHVVLD